MKIALVTDDHKTISAHFGLAQFYEIFTIEAGKVTAHETLVRSNPQIASGGEGRTPGQEQRHHQHDHNAMIAPIAGCQALLARGMGTGAHLSLKKHGIQPVITDIPEIQAAVDAYLAGTLMDHPERLH